MISISEIKSAINLPVIAEIPIENNGNPIAINEGPATATSEQLRALRTKLHYIHGNRSNGRVTLVTSSIAGEGKSFVSTNLSISLALTQRKVVLLELDMRKPKVTKVFNINNDNLGLSDYFMNKASISSIIQKSGIASNLDIIGSGTPIHNPAELLEKSELEVLIDELRKTYDDIVIDSPPVHLVPDAVTVSKHADTCLYIVRQGITSKNELTFLQSLIDQDQLKNVSIVFNSINSVKHGYGYKYDNSYYNHTKRNVLQSIFSDFKNRF
ncbi:MAG: polysaccharide biosynthesis tyrosine autokinase [Pedobacter sp.]|nr:MAG: polysaccharide biosynthesis tyrosine autokinase [Pedobacter sp.]